MPSTEDYRLAITLDPRRVPVSYLSSLLRVAQAALREVARSHEGARQAFERRPQPMLIVPGTLDDELGFHLIFVDPAGGGQLPGLSSMVFDAFLDHLADFVRGLPQPGLWGGASRRSAPRSFESDVDRRMDQLYRELHRSPMVTLRFRGRKIEIEGDRMEIS